MRPTLVRPEIRRGPVFDYGPRPVIDPTHLRPGVDVLIVAQPGGLLPRGTLVLYVGHSAGYAAVAVEREGCGLEVVLVAAAALDEHRPLVDPSHPDFLDFREGFELGVWEVLNERPVSERSRGRKPTWFGLGVVAGYRSRLKGEAGWDADVRAFNELLRRKPPEEWPGPLPWERRVA